MNTQLNANPGTQITHFASIEQKRLIIQFINQIMLDGKKAKAYSILEETFLILSYGETRLLRNPAYTPAATTAAQPLPRIPRAAGAPVAYARETRNARFRSFVTGETRNARFHYVPLNCLVLFIHAIENIQPLLEVRKIRKSGRTLYIPKIIPSKRGKKIAMKWLLEEAKKNNTNKIRNKTLAQCLAVEILNAFKKLDQ